MKQPRNKTSTAIANLQNKVVKVKLDLDFSKLKYALLFLAVATGVAGSIIGIYTYNKFIPEDTIGINVPIDTEVLNSKQIGELVSKISQIAFLPDDELPEVLFINNLTEIRTNPFFKDAKLKDYILFYKKAGKIIVYNPQLHKIVNQGPYAANLKKETSPTPSSQIPFEPNVKQTPQKDIPEATDQPSGP